MKYDDASWHYNGDFPDDLPDKAGGTHIGMFVAWCLLNGMAGELHYKEFSEDLEELTKRKMTPGAWFLKNCDEKFIDEDLNCKGNEFATYYYDSDEALYVLDYENTVGQNIKSLYYVPDTWETYDSLAPVINSRFKKWEQTYE